MTATVNGESRSFVEGTTIGQMLRELHVEGAGIAVARNGRVVRAALFDSEELRDGDVIEVIRAVAGG